MILRDKKLIKEKETLLLLNKANNEHKRHLREGKPRSKNLKMSTTDRKHS
jgi:hypothetical protein